MLRQRRAKSNGLLLEISVWFVYFYFPSTQTLPVHPPAGKGPPLPSRGKIRHAALKLRLAAADTICVTEVNTPLFSSCSP
jgi:hypothetical protein